MKWIKDTDEGFVPWSSVVNIERDWSGSHYAVGVRLQSGELRKVLYVSFPGGPGDVTSRLAAKHARQLVKALEHPLDPAVIEPVERDRDAGDQPLEGIWLIGAP